MDPASEVLKQSASHSWEALMVAFFCIACVGLLVWLMKSWANESHNREERMAKRIDDLENFTRNALLEALHDNARALTELTATLHNKPCLLSTNDQSMLMKHLCDVVMSPSRKHGKPAEDE